MVSRLMALWFTMIVMALSTSLLSLVAEGHYHHFCSFQGAPVGSDLPFLPLISRVFINWEGWIYYYPSFFIFGAAWATWKWKNNSKITWGLVAVSLGTMILFASAFYVAVELPYMSAIRFADPS